jgi:hypothetical protein
MGLLCEGMYLSPLMLVRTFNFHGIGTADISVASHTTQYSIEVVFIAIFSSLDACRRSEEGEHECEYLPLTIQRF